jgi:hypothetical protein
LKVSHVAGDVKRDLRRLMVHLNVLIVRGGLYRTDLLLVQNKGATCIEVTFCHVSYFGILLMNLQLIGSFKLNMLKKM